jgi:1-acyl-sn-glycerol-3-phosphate acyltransferase
VAAARAGADVVPIAVRGARAVLPDLARLPRRGRIEVEIGDPMPASSAVDPAASVQGLCQRARSFIAARCGEPDLAAVAIGACATLQPRAHEDSAP